MESENIDNNKTLPQKPAPAGEVFHFQRMSGLDQAILKTDEEWLNLDKLDQKLWMALSCPIRGLEFSADTLSLMDSDKDGRIRSNEVLEAVAWVCRRIAHPANLRQCAKKLFPDDIRADTEEGERLARAIKLVQGKGQTGPGDGVDLEEVEAVLAEAAGYPFNGDGIVPPESATRTEMANFIKTALAVVGAKRDASGKPGLDAALAMAFRERLSAILAWRKAVKNADLPLGEKTGEAWELLTRLGPKIDDYFYRCRLAEFVPDLLERLNDFSLPQATGNESASASTVQGIGQDVLEAMPLARITQSKLLTYGEAINPAWAGPLQNFRQLLMPLISEAGGNDKNLDENVWQAVKKRFASYADTLQSKPQYGRAPEDAEKVLLAGYPSLALASAGDALGRAFLPPDADAALAALDDAEIGSLLAPENEKAFAELVEQDLAAPPLAAIQELRKAVLYNSNLYTFLMNFISFLDFYNPEKKAIFQTGTLYLDSRACYLCVPVADMEVHTRLAAQSNLCLIYCALSRREEDGSERSANIAAALTDGTLAMLIEGRHGVFVDNDGKEWDSRITRIIHNPINLEEAVWAPYIRLANMANEQIQKFVAAKDNAIAKATSDVAGKIGAAQPPAEQKGGFDFAKGAGIFAALSVALSVLSAAFAYIAHSVVSLGWWWPLALVVIFLCISGPSVIMAWFKLRRRSLSPLLDASGWAVNEGAPINIRMGNSLTAVGKLPPNAKCDMDDPYGLTARLLAQKRRRRILWQWLILLIALGIGFACWCYFVGEPAWLLKLRVNWGI